MQVNSIHPSANDLERSQTLAELITAEISANQGALSFERYMQLCLYADELGYYACGEFIFGERGDFVTSSEVSDHFAKAFADHLCANQSQLTNYSLIEIGAGSGRFAAQLLTELDKRKFLPARYYIVEASAGLRKRQQEFLSAELTAGVELIDWVEDLTKPVACGVVIANEVIDALPVRLLSIQKEKVIERCVQLNANQFEFVGVDADEDLIRLVKERVVDRDVWQLPTYHTEVCTRLASFIQQITSFVKQGLFFFIDYGYPRSEYYHVQRAMGTLLCHYQHHAQDNPLLWPGLQDISCNVDFTALAEAGTQAGLELECYCTQAQFLLASNILNSIDGDLEDSSALKQLMLPGAMGERFQVMVFNKQQSIEHAFTTRDLTHRL